MDENPQKNDETPQEPENNGAPISDPTGAEPEASNPESAPEVAPVTPNEATPANANAWKKAPAPKKKLPKKSSFVDFTICLATAVAIALLLRGFIFQPFKIPTNSMHPTLVGNFAHGDRILVNLLTYKLSEPQRWDVFVFKCPAKDIEPDKSDYIKRLVGLPGEKLNVKNGDIFVNGKIARKPRHVQNGIWIKEFEDNFDKQFIDSVYKYWSFDRPDKWKYNQDGTVIASSTNERTQISYNRVINSENTLFPESNITNVAPFRYLRITKSTKITCPFCKQGFAPGEWEIKRPEIGEDKREDFYLQCQNRNCGQQSRLEIEQTHQSNKIVHKLLVYGKDANKPTVVEDFGDITGLNEEDANRSGSSALSKTNRKIVGDIKSSLDFKFLEKDSITFMQTKIDRTTYTLYLAPDFPLSDITRNYLLVSNESNTSKHKLNSDKILKTSKSISASLETCDHSLNIVVNGEVIYQFPFSDDFDRKANEYFDNSVSFGINNGKVAFDSWNIYKDIYYLSTFKAQDTYCLSGSSKEFDCIDLTADSQDPDLPNRYFAMGDNSALSSDSREWGGVPKANIIGKAILVLWPPKHVKMIR